MGMFERRWYRGMLNLSPSQGPRRQLASGFLENGEGDDYGRSVDSRRDDCWSPAMSEEDSLATIEGKRKEPNGRAHSV